MKRQLTPEQERKREERKAKLREVWGKVAAMPEAERQAMAYKLGIVTCEGHALSANNQVLIMFQGGASVVGGFRQWLKQGRCVMKGQHGLGIWVPTKRKAPEGTEAPANGESGAPERHGFIFGTVFDISQTAPVGDQCCAPVESEPVQECPSIYDVAKQNGECVPDSLCSNPPITITPQPAKVKTVRLDDQTRETLMRSEIAGNTLRLPAQLPRDEYLRVAKAIEAAGGKWSRSGKCHVFPDDVRKTLNITEESTEVVNVQQTFQTFYTPVALAARVAELADLVSGDRVLEPSAGTGRLVAAIRAHGIFADHIVAVDIKANASLRLVAGKVVEADFLTCNGNLGTFDKILMNPPFANGQDIKHIQHALTMLNPGGRLVAICANGPRQREALEPIATEWIDLEPGAFKESGTNVNAAIVVIDKEAA